MRKYDVVVVGAGPAGATAAFTTARAGWRTALIERQSLHRPKVCGGLVTSASADVVRETFGRDIAQESLVDPGVLSVYLIPPSGLANGLAQHNKKIYNVTRKGFDGWLTDQAVAAGAVPRDNNRLLSVLSDGPGFVLQVETSQGPDELACRYLIGADGVYSSVRKSIRPDYPNSLANLLQEYYPHEGKFEPYFYVFLKKLVSPTYAYVIPKNGYAMLGTERVPGVPPGIDEGMANLRAWLRREFGFSAHPLAYREGWSVPFGSVCYGEGDAILIGDAGGFCHPFTAEGILYGLQAASRVVDYIDESEAQSRPLSAVFCDEFGMVGELMSGFKDYVLKIGDPELERLVVEKRAALSEAFAWDAAK